MNLIYTSLLLLATSLQTLALDLSSSSKILTVDGCLSEDVVKEIESDFQFTFDENVNNSKLDACDPKQILNRTYRGLMFLKYGKFSSLKRYHNKLFNNSFATESPYEFVRNRIKFIDFKLCNNPNVMAYSRRHWNRFVVCVDSIEATERDGSYVSPINFASTSVHEARHTDADDKGHFTCRQGILKGSVHCDQDLAQNGAFHYQIEYLVKIAQSADNIHPAIRSTSRAESIFRLLNFLNTVPKINQNKYLFLRLQGESQLLSLSSNYSLKNIGSISHEKIFSRPEGFLMSYDSVDRLFHGWDYMVGARDIVGSYAIDYNNQKIDIREPVIDYQIAHTQDDFTSGMITGQTLKYSIYDEKKMIADDSIILPFQGAKRFLKPIFCKGDRDHIYILTNDNFVYEGAINDSNQMQFLEKANCELGFLNIVEFNNKKLGLTVDGRLLESKRNTWIPIIRTKGKRFDFLSEPFDIYDLFNPTVR